MSQINKSQKSGLVTLLLLLFLGLGVHRFYVGRWKTGLLYLFTLEFLGVGRLIDLILLLTGNFRDNQKRVIKL